MHWFGRTQWFSDTAVGFRRMIHVVHVVDLLFSCVAEIYNSVIYAWSIRAMKWQWHSAKSACQGDWFSTTCFFLKLTYKITKTIQKKFHNYRKVELFWNYISIQIRFSSELLAEKSPNWAVNNGHFLSYRDGICWLWVYTLFPQWFCVTALRSAA